MLLRNHFLAHRKYLDVHRQFPQKKSAKNLGGGVHGNFATIWKCDVWLDVKMCQEWNWTFLVHNLQWFSMIFSWILEVHTEAHTEVAHHLLAQIKYYLLCNSNVNKGLTSRRCILILGNHIPKYFFKILMYCMAVYQLATVRSGVCVHVCNDSCFILVHSRFHMKKNHGDFAMSYFNEWAYDYI